MVEELPEQLIAQAGFLLCDAVLNEANVRRAVSAAYYALFHLLIRDAVLSWRHADQRARLARNFEHRQMKQASAAILREIDSAPGAASGPEQAVRFQLSTVAQAFLDLQQARHDADYDIADAFDPRDAAVHVAQARLAFSVWNEIRNEPPAEGYLYSLLFRDREPNKWAKS